MRRVTVRITSLAGVLLLLLATVMMMPANAQVSQNFRKKGSFEDAKFDLMTAITNRGLVVDLTGNVGAMLKRTGPDVGSTKPIYKAAEYMTFCSAKLSRAMMEIDPANLSSCPYVMYIYETVARPGEIVIGYRRLRASGNFRSRRALTEVNRLLDGIAREAVR